MDALTEGDVIEARVLYSEYIEIIAPLLITSIERVGGRANIRGTVVYNMAFDWSEGIWSPSNMDAHIFIKEYELRDVEAVTLVPVEDYYKELDAFKKWHESIAETL